MTNAIRPQPVRRRPRLRARITRAITVWITDWKDNS